MPIRASVTTRTMITLHTSDGPGPKVIALSGCGFPEQTHFEVLRVLFRRMTRNMGAELIGEIYRGEAGLLLRKEPELQAIMRRINPFYRLLEEKLPRILLLVTRRKRNWKSLSFHTTNTFRRTTSTFSRAMPAKGSYRNNFYSSSPSLQAPHQDSVTGNVYK